MFLVSKIRIFGVLQASAPTAPLPAARQPDPSSSLPSRRGIGNLPPAQAPGEQGKAPTLLRLQIYQQAELMEKRVRAA